ncbi:MAG: hypothetical protein R8G01_03925 [Ilumatobacteraceae bacterium]|nr:hypothetical protein [Ilumatobacteraceae bacterium]
MRTDDQLIEAIRHQLAGRAERAGGGAAEPSRSGALANLRRKRDKLLQLFLDDKITEDYFADNERSLTNRINALEADHADTLETAKTTNALAQAFERAAALLRDPDFDFDAIWANANDKERRVLIEELIEAVTIHADRLEVTVTGAPPFLVKLDEVGLRPSGTGPVVSEDRRERSRRDRGRRCRSVSI